MSEQEKREQERLRQALEDRRLDRIVAHFGREIVRSEARRIRAGENKPRKKTL